MGKYSLVFIDKKSDKRCIIKMKEQDPKTGEVKYKEKVNLATVDRNTTYFESFESMCKYLFDTGKLDFIPTECFIEYNQYGVKKVPVVYKNNELLRNLCRKANSYIPRNDRLFIDYANSFVHKMNNGRYYRFMVENKYLNDYLVEKLRTYVYEDNIDESFVMNLISEALANYKTLRGIVLGNIEYEKNGYVPTNNKKYVEQVKPTMEIPKPIKYTEPIKINTEMTLDDNVLALYTSGGMDSIYSAYDNEQLERLDPETKKIIKLM